MLCAWAITWEGTKVLIHLAPGTKESTDLIRASDTWRGLKVTQFELGQLKRLQKQLADGHLKETQPLIQKGSTPDRISRKNRT